MPDSIMYREDAFVVLEADEPEQILSPQELLEKLKNLLQNTRNGLPRELQKIPDLEGQARYLMENFCEFDLGPDRYLQWYVVRLEK